MPENPISEYDKFAYPSALYPQSHPERLATIATLFDLQPARIDRARVLELGCGDGNNLITMACTLPHGSFHGIDLAIGPIRRGQETIAALGLKNVTLRQMNLLEAPADLGVFDYIIAHGLYSWVPEAVREKILAICREHLAENGVAYISYNAYPGNHVRDAARRMMQFHVQQFSEPAEKIRQARAFLKFLAEAKSKPGVWQDVLRHQFERIEKYVDAGFFHDDLSPVNQPFYFYEFMQAAGRHQLQYLAEADFTGMQLEGVGAEAVEVIRKMETINFIIREQYLDFIVGRAFRQTLLCRQGRQLDRWPKPERAYDLFIASDVGLVNSSTNPVVAGIEDFRRGKIVIATSQPVLKSALLYLEQVWPRRVPFSELLTKACDRAGRAALGSDRRDLGEFLIRCYGVGIVDLHAYASTFISEISERPMASALARLQVQSGSPVSSLRHLPLKIEDAMGRELLRLLDGTRDRAELLEQLSKTKFSAPVTASTDGTRPDPSGSAGDRMAGQLETSLINLAKLGLLVG